MFERLLFSLCEGSEHKKYPLKTLTNFLCISRWRWIWSDNLEENESKKGLRKRSAKGNERRRRRKGHSWRTQCTIPAVYTSISDNTRSPTLENGRSIWRISTILVRFYDIIEYWKHCFTHSVTENTLNASINLPKSTKASVKIESVTLTMCHFVVVTSNSKIRT